MVYTRNPLKSTYVWKILNTYLNNSINEKNIKNEIKMKNVKLILGNYLNIKFLYSKNSKFLATNSNTHTHLS